jgi:hypothetical protein
MDMPGAMEMIDNQLSGTGQLRQKLHEERVRMLFHKAPRD